MQMNALNQFMFIAEKAIKNANTGSTASISKENHLWIFWIHWKRMARISGKENPMNKIHTIDRVFQYMIKNRTVPPASADVR